MKQTIYAVVALLLIGLASIVPWSQAQQQASPVVIWCQDASGGTAPCLAGNSLDYDTGAGTVLQGTAGFVLPGSGGPVAGGTAGAPLRTDPTGTTPQPVTGSVTANAGTNLNTSALALESGGNLANAASGIGAIGDAAASPGGTGSVNAKLRTATDLLNQLLTELGQKTEPANTQLVGDGSGPLTVDGTVATTQSGTWTMQPGNTANTTPWLVTPGGNVAHGAVDSGNPVKMGCNVRTTNRTGEVAGDRADVSCDKNGNVVVTMNAQRDRVVRSGAISLSTTTETTLIAAGGAGVFRDITYLKCTNGSATPVRMDLRDATAGTVIDHWDLAANGGGFNLSFHTPYAQATANNNWTVQLSAAVSTVLCAAQAVEKN